MDHRKTNLNFGLLFSIKAVDGGYTDWSESKCSVTCGGGVKTLTRSCTNPPASNGGKDCSQLGPAKKTVPCNEQKCCKFFLVTIFCSSLFIRFSPIMLAEASIHVLQSSEKWPFSFSKGWSSFSTIQLLTGGTQIGLSRSAVWRVEEEWRHLQEPAPIPCHLTAERTAVCLGHQKRLFRVTNKNAVSF